jgi:hypothetical protein
MWMCMNVLLVTFAAIEVPSWDEDWASTLVEKQERMQTTIYKTNPTTMVFKWTDLWKFNAPIVFITLLLLMCKS